MLRRWAHNRRRGLDVKGYPRKSSTEQGVPGIECCASVLLDSPEDASTYQAMLDMRECQTINYMIATEHYYYGVSLSVIGRKLRLSESIVSSRHAEIKDFIADRVLY